MIVVVFELIMYALAIYWGFQVAVTTSALYKKTTGLNIAKIEGLVIASYIFFRTNAPKPVSVFFSQIKLAKLFLPCVHQPIYHYENLANSIVVMKVTMFLHPLIHSDITIK